MSNSFKFIEVLDYGSGYIADRYVNLNYRRPPAGLGRLIIANR
jgi:hypothetical protein